MTSLFFVHHSSMHDHRSSLFAEIPYIRRKCALSPAQLADIDRELQQLLQQDADRIRKTHYFHGRYENIYVDSKNGSSGITDLDLLIDEALGHCADLLRLAPERLKIGFWFNLMEPGQVTTLHRHDDNDEIISGVVYLVVPENSGDLVLVTDKRKIDLPPVAGNFVFFSPQTPHKVNQNCSSARRLSIGMNIGILDEHAGDE